MGPPLISDNIDFKARSIFHTEKKKNIILNFFEDSNIVSSCINQNLAEMEEKINISIIRVWGKTSREKINEAISNVNSMINQFDLIDKERIHKFSCGDGTLNKEYLYWAMKNF